MIGVGHIARAVAARAKPFGARLIGVTRSPKVVADFEWVRGMDALHDFLGQCDFIVVACPLSPETTDLISAAELVVKYATSSMRVFVDCMHELRTCTSLDTSTAKTTHQSVHGGHMPLSCTRKKIKQPYSTTQHPHLLLCRPPSHQSPVRTPLKYQPTSATRQTGRSVQPRPAQTWQPYWRRRRTQGPPQAQDPPPWGPHTTLVPGCP